MKFEFSRIENRGEKGLKNDRTLIVMLFLLSIISLSFANSCNVALQLDFGGAAGDPASVNENWKTWSVIGLFISSLIVALVYMFGKVSENVALLNRAKTDSVQIIATSVLLVLFYMFMTAACGIDPHQFGINANTMFDGAKLYFEYSRSVAFFAYNEAVNSIMLVSGMSSIFTRFSLWSYGAVIDLSGGDNPFVGFSTVVGILQYMTNMTMLTVAMTTAYIDIFAIIENQLLNFLLPAGIVMRCFTPTREFGGVLIALAIGLFIFYPLMFSFSYMVLGNPGPKAQPSEAGWFTTVNGMAVLFASAGFVPHMTLAIIPMQIPFVGGMGANAINDAIAAAGETLLPVFILPAINWIIIVAFVRNLSKILGEEIDISSLSRMI